LEARPRSEEDLPPFPAAAATAKSRPDLSDEIMTAVRRVLGELGGEDGERGNEVVSGRCSAFEHEDAAEVQLSSCPGAQAIQSSAPSRHEASLQTETLSRIWGVACSCGVNRDL
jgi:hypothetical protein